MVQAPNLPDDPSVPLPKRLQVLEERFQGLVEALEHRIFTLEERLTAVENTDSLEKRIAERVCERLGRTPRAAGESTNILIQASRRFLPSAIDSIRSRPDPEPVSVPQQRTSRRAGWLVFDLFDEFRAIFWMFLDPHYRLSWTARLILPVILLMILVSWWLFGGPLFFVLDKLIDIVLIVIGYTALSREAQRYLDSIAIPRSPSTP